MILFNEDSNISLMIFHSQPRLEHKLGKKRHVEQINVTFHETNVFFFKCLTLHTSKINSFLGLKRN